MNKPSYQLTKHPVGSILEILTISWPLILSLLSMSVMLFSDRLLLSRYSIKELNATASAGTAVWLFLVLPISIAAISEVFVGRFHGEERHRELGHPVWQMIWFGVFVSPILWLISWILPSFLFFESPNRAEETIYFTTLLLFAPALVINIATSGFFIGSGNVKIVTFCAIIANAINILLDYLLIYGFGPIPSLGIFGAALGTGIAEITQCLILFAFFMNRDNRFKYDTGNFSFKKSLFLESLRIGFPAGLGLTIEVLAHFIFFKIVGLSGQQNLTIVALVQSLYFLVFFLFEGLSKGVTTVCANLLGGKQYHYIKNVLRSAGILQTLFFLCIGSLFFFFSDLIVDFFLNQSDEALIMDSKFLYKVKWGIFWMVLFFLFDGYTRILAGQLTAAGDTKFLLYAGILLNISAYILPILLVIYLGSGTADAAWMIIFCYGVTTFFVYYIRYISKKWVKSSQIMEKN